MSWKQVFVTIVLFIVGWWVGYMQGFIPENQYVYIFIIFIGTGVWWLTYLTTSILQKYTKKLYDREKNE